MSHFLLPDGTYLAPSGEVLCAAPADADGIAAELGRVRAALAELRARERTLVLMVASLCEDQTTRTRRVRGNSRVLRVTMPPPAWDQAQLKLAWAEHDFARDRLLRVERLGVQAVELDKARRTSGPDDFTRAVRAVLLAERPATAPPTVTLEE